jgi:hypothetical protein
MAKAIKLYPVEGKVNIASLDLREADKREARAFLGMEPMEALKLSLKYSDEIWAIIDDDKYEAFFGVCQGDGYGIPWFVSTDKFEEFKIAFARQSREYVKYMLKRYKKLQNYVSTDNRKSIAWLKWLGFTIHPLEERFHDPDIFFYKFTKEVE